MKQLLIISTLLLPSLSLNAWAGPGADHAHGKEHASTSTSIGQPGSAAKVQRSITVEMKDAMRFTPASVEVKRGETVKFIVKNVGRIQHEMVLGTQEELLEHAAMMRQHPGMTHADNNQVSVAPGKSAELIWQFGKAGKLDFACLVPGHFEAGMKGAIAIK